MTVSWNNQYNPNELARYIEECRKVDDSGQVRFEGFQFMEYEVLLYSMLDFPAAVPEIEGRRIAQHAIFKAGRTGVIIPNNLLAEANKLTQEYIQRSLERYVLATTLSFLPSVSLGRIKLGNTIVIFESSLPHHYQGGRLQIVEKAKHSLFAEPPTDYLFVRVHVSAKSSYEAVDKAIDTLDLVRGIWNWFHNRRHWIRSSSGKRAPVNKIVLGPLHTLHYLTGDPATEAWWYQPKYCAAVSPYNPSSDDIDGMTGFLKNVRNRLSKSNYHETLKQAIIRYGRSLDMRDWEGAFLKLWSILELLTDSCYDSNAVTARRAAYIYEDRDFALQVVKHLRAYRNRSVHADVGNAAIETYVYQLKGFVEALLEFHLGSSYGFESVSEATRFLELPSNKDAIKTRIKMLQYAQKFHEHT